MFKSSLTLAVLLTVLGSVLDPVTSQTTCDPSQNCKLPDCRCWNDKDMPGMLDVGDTPQIVLVSFGYSVTGANEGMYTSIFDNIVNPNGCPIKGTFFVQLANSDLKVVKTLADRKHEVGVTTVKGTTPTDRQDWINQLNEVKAELELQGIPANNILGVRAPELFVGGDDQFDAIDEAQLEYDSSCVSQIYTSAGKLLWPYTYDFVDETPKCIIGKDPEKPHKGKWQFLVADLKYENQICATPSSCSPFFNTSQEAFNFLFSSFEAHYGSNKAPFVLYIDPLWLTVDYQMQATQEFLEFIRAGFDDTWIITNQQALAWMKDPTPTSKIDDFEPWKC